MIEYCLKTKIKPNSNNIIRVVQPKATPKIKGIDFLKPKLNPECDAKKLLGPGV